MFISDIAIRRPVFTAMIILSLIIFGVVSLMRLPLELFPNVELPVVTVTTVWRGSDPETIETRVSDPLEGAMATIAGLKRLNSTSMEGASIVVMEFHLDKDVDVAYQEVQQKISSIRADLPTDIEEPIVQKIAFDAAPIMQVVLSGDLSARELYQVADKDVRERLQRIGNVGTISIVGGRERKLWLWLDPERMKQHDLTLRDVRAALAAQHVEMPGGRVEDARQELITRVKAEFQSAAEIDELILAHVGGATVRLKDVGWTEDGLEEERSYAQRDGIPCITLEIMKQSNTNTVKVAEDLRKEVATIASELQAQGREMKLEITVDMSTYIEDSVNQVYHHLVIGGIMAVGTVLVFLLNGRSTLICALVLPTSIMAAFMMMGAIGFTVNVMTLMALQLAIGLLIDDAIVVQENIMRHVEEGKPARFAASFATREIGLAVLATTLSVVAVFLPTAYTQGIVGQMFFPFGMTISFAVIISMSVSFTLDPMLSSRLLRRRERHNFLFRMFEAGFEFLERTYARMLRAAIRVRWLVLFLAFVCFVLSLAVSSKYAKLEFQPENDRSEFNVVMRAPLGASLGETRAIMEKLRAEVIRETEVQYVVYTIGGSTTGGAEGRVNTGSMYVRMLPKAERQDRGLRTQRDLMDHLRDRLALVPGTRAVGVQAFNPMSGSTGMESSVVQFELLGPDLAELERISGEVVGWMRRSGGYTDIDTTHEPGRPEVSIFVDRERAREMGISPMDVAETIRAGIGGVDIGKFRAGKDRYDISMRLLESARNDPEKILDLTIPSMYGGPVELRNVARVAPTSVPVEINRFNRQRQITIMANLDKSKSLGEAKDELNTLVTEIGLPPGYSTAWSGQAEIMGESFANLGFTMILSLVVMFMVLAAQFESLVHPFTIMLTLPLAFVGAILALLMFGQTINIMTIMAFIFLLGLVCKNAILLIDYTNTLRERDGLARDEALRRAGPVRLRPILMTTTAMIMGMLPTALGAGEGSESFQPMAIAIIGGLISSTLLTLLVVPSAYSILDPISEWMRHRIINRGLEHQTPAPATPVPPPMEKPAGKRREHAPVG